MSDREDAHAWQVLETDRVGKGKQKTKQKREREREKRYATPHLLLVFVREKDGWAAAGSRSSVCGSRPRPENQ